MISEGNEKRSSVQTKGKTQSSKSKEAFSDSASTTANVMDIEDVKRAALNMVWNAYLADEMAKRFKQLKRVWDEASTWAELTPGGDPDYASRLRYSYLNAFSEEGRGLGWG